MSAVAPSSSTVPVRRAPPRPGVLTRLHFAWFAFWVALWTLLFTPCVLLHALVRPGARTLKLWMTLWGRLVLFCSGIRVHREVRATLDPARPVVFVANHQNSLDIFTAAGYVPHPFGFTAKAA